MFSHTVLSKNATLDGAFIGLNCSAIVGIFKVKLLLKLLILRVCYLSLNKYINCLTNIISVNIFRAHKDSQTTFANELIKHNKTLFK